MRAESFKYRSLQEDIVSLRALRAAWFRVQQGGSARGADGRGLDDFALHADERLAHLSESLRAGTYRPRPLRPITLRRTGKADRLLALPCVRDRVIHAALYLALRDRVEPALSDAAWAYRPGRSHKAAVRRLRSLCAEDRPVVARGDVAGFFPSVSHAHVLAALDDLLCDAWTSALIERLLRTPVEGRAPSRGRGLPQGSALSPLLSNLVLVPFDRAFERAGLPLVRYADDFAVACRSEGAARHALKLATGSLRRLGLYLNTRKSRIEPAASSRFLGQVVGSEKPQRTSPTAPVRHAVGAAIAESGPASVSAETSLLSPPATSDGSGNDGGGAAGPPPGLGVGGEGRRKSPPRRVLYVETQGATVRVRGERLVVTEPGGNEAARVGLPLVGEVVTFGTVHVSAEAARRCLEAGVPIVLLDRRGGFRGRLTGPVSHGPAALRSQCSASDDPARRVVVARALVEAKLRASRALLLSRAARMPREAARSELTRAAQHLNTARKRLTETHDMAGLLGIEGAAAASYFRAFRVLFGDGPMAFTGRNRRPPTDPPNALLSYVYTLGYRCAWGACEAGGLHPAVGFLHTDRPGHAALASDLLEPVRPYLDAAVLAAVRRGSFGVGDFEYRDEGCFLHGAARNRAVNFFERTMRRSRPRLGDTVYGALRASVAGLHAHLRDGTHFAPFQTA